MLHIPIMINNTIISEIYAVNKVKYYDVTYVINGEYKGNSKSMKFNLPIEKGKTVEMLIVNILKYIEEYNEENR